MIDLLICWYACGLIVLGISSCFCSLSLKDVLVAIIGGPAFLIVGLCAWIDDHLPDGPLLWRRD